MVLRRLCYALHSINAYMSLVGKGAVDILQNVWNILQKIKWTSVLSSFTLEIPFLSSQLTTSLSGWVEVQLHKTRIVRILLIICYQSRSFFNSRIFWGLFIFLILLFIVLSFFPSLREELNKWWVSVLWLHDSSSLFKRKATEFLHEYFTYLHPCLQTWEVC